MLLISKGKSKLGPMSIVPKSLILKGNPYPISQLSRFSISSSFIRGKNGRFLDRFSPRYDPNVIDPESPFRIVCVVFPHDPNVMVPCHSVNPSVILSRTCHFDKPGRSDGALTRALLWSSNITHFLNNPLVPKTRLKTGTQTLAGALNWALS